MALGEKQYITPVLILIICIILCTGCVSLSCSYIPDQYLQNGWHENLALRNTGMQVFGLEKWCSITYSIEGKYPAFLTITTYKTLILPEKQQLLNQIKNIIQHTFQEQIIINENSEISGSRTLYQNHKSFYLIYEGIDVSNSENITVKLIGEVWTCDTTGSSIICIGIAHTTQADGSKNLQQWSTLVMDLVGSIENCTGSDGLIYNILCH